MGNCLEPKLIPETAERQEIVEKSDYNTFQFPPMLPSIEDNNNSTQLDSILNLQWEDSEDEEFVKKFADIQKIRAEQQQKNLPAYDYNRMDLTVVKLPPTVISGQQEISSDQKRPEVIISANLEAVHRPIEEQK